MVERVPASRRRTQKLRPIVGSYPGTICLVFLWECQQSAVSCLKYKMPQYDTRNEIGKNKNIYRNIYQDTSSNRHWSSATRYLISHWKGSCFKLIKQYFAVWLLFYILIGLLYRHVLFYEPKARQVFKLMCVYASKFSNFIPITFLTGFYVTQVVNRWWDQFMSLPWPDHLALKLVSFCPGMVILTTGGICHLQNIVIIHEYDRPVHSALHTPISPCSL